MKQFFLLLLLFPLVVFSQTYPFREGFEGLPSTQVPQGWGGTMKVLLDHGLNDSKGLAARVSSAVTVDSAITPLIGPLTSASSFSFYYRIIDQNIYPSTPTDLDVGDQIEIMISTDSTNYHLIELIDMNNHTPSFNFVKKKIFIPQYADSAVYFKILCQYGNGSSFYADFDTIVVADDVQLSVEDISIENDIFVYPNPCNSSVCIQMPTSSEVGVFNSLGKNVFQNISTIYSQMSTADWADGIYFIRIANFTRQFTRKLIVQH